MNRSLLLSLLRTAALFGVALCLPPNASCRAEGEIDFSRDIRPILSANCFTCHGADQRHREAQLRLDLREEATAEREDGAAIIPGKPAQSLLVKRISSKSDAEVMPPRDSGKSLKREQIELLTRWVESGADYSEHWAFAPPVRPPIPALRDPSQLRTPIDAFVLHKLAEQGLVFSPPADPVVWLRRLHLDLIGLPPEPAAVARFQEELDSAGGDDQSREAVYASWVESLLASPHYGEKWGRHWLDAARYADSDGFEKDKPRNVWFYRDYVINAMNEDKPYNQFLIEQLAGDLLPGATQDQIVATGFLRNSMLNEEGGIDPEQFRMEAMYDRMDAIGKAMLGLTIQCCQCHNHKYDPFTQVDYYRMFAFLNNSHEGSITVYTREQQQQRQQLLGEITDIEDQLKQSDPHWREKLNAWARSVSGDQPEWTILRPQFDGSGGQKEYLLEDGSILCQGYAPTKHTTQYTVETPATRISAFRLELLNDPNLPHQGPGRGPDGLCALTEFKATVQKLGEGGKPQDVKFTQATADVNPPETELASRYDDKSKKRRVTGPIEFANDDNNETAWGIDIGGGRSNVPRKAVFNLEQPLESEQGFRVTIKLVQMHGGWNSDDNQTNNLGRFRLSLTDAGNVSADPLPADVRALVTLDPTQRTDAQTATLFSYWRRGVDGWQGANDRIEALWQRHPRGTSQLVAREREVPRVTHRLERGNFLKPAEVVSPGVPGWMPPLLAADPRHPTRLDFARWLADRKSPTVARSIVNRIWQAYFGIGLIETSEDLGTQGALPTHPKLLDWLAVELMDNGWGLKHIHRLICLSTAYRQTSEASPQLHATDPYNRWLARGPRFRLDAELVRDVSLSASGLLTADVGGPSVYPPAPEFLFSPPASYGPKTWAYDEGPAKYRRGLYTFRFRSVPYPVLQNFDSPNGDFACVRRSRSNTPLQALTTLNEPLFLECAQALAKKTIREGGATDEDKVTFAFRRCLSRTPDDEERTTLLEFLDRQRSQLEESPSDAALLAEQSSPATENSNESNPLGTAAWTALARVILNLDETITKE